MSLSQDLAKPLEELGGARRLTLDLVGRMRQEQLDHVPAAGRWSVGEVLDHLARMESYFRGLIRQLIDRTMAGEKPTLETTFADFNPSPQFLPKSRLPALEGPFSLLSSVTPFLAKETFARYRMVRMETPDVGLPQGGGAKSDLIAALDSGLTGTVGLVEEHPDLDFRNMTVRHPLSGRTDIPQILTVLALHERRHHRQIADIVSSLGFPGDTAAFPPGITRWTEWILSLDRAGPPRLGERALLSALLGCARLAAAVAIRADTRVARRELANTVSTFRLFRLGACLLPRGEREQPLAPLTAGLRRYGLFASLWAVEGVGYQRAERHYPPTAALLGDDVAGSLPVGCLVPLHVGAGLALARCRLATENHQETEGANLRLLVDEILRGSATGSAGVGIEAIGLMVRTLAPERLPALDGVLRELEPDVRAWFWHGVGRALYFLFPRTLYGNAGWLRVAAEAPDGGALRPARAGYVWALCLVNTGYPAVIEAFLRRHGEGLDEAAFRHGLVGTTLVWHAWAGADPRLARRLASRPSAADLDWDERVRRPLLAALEETAPALALDRRVERLFLFRSDAS